MKHSVGPSIFIGLGDRGAEIAATVSKTICDQDAGISDLHVSVIMDHSGVVRLTSGGNAEVPINGLRQEVDLDVWSSNYRVLIEQEKDIANLLVDCVQSVRNTTVIERLKDSGVTVRSNIMVIVYCPIFDAIGSAALIPFLVTIKKVFHDQLKLLDFQLNLILFGPNLFDESAKQELCLIRSYCCIAELDYLISIPEKIMPSGSFPISNIWLLEKGDEARNYMTQYKEIIPTISESVLLLLTGAVQPREIAALTVGNKVGSKGCYYSSFGLKFLEFPVDRVMEGIRDYLTSRIVEGKTTVAAGSVDKGAAYADAHRLFVKMEVPLLIDRIGEYKGGSSIWRDFFYSGKINKETNVEIFAKELVKQFEAFVSQDLQEMYGQIAARCDQLQERLRSELWQEVLSRVDSKEVTGFAQAVALLAAMNNRDDVVFSGVNPAIPLTLEQLRSDIYGYFYDKLHMTPYLARLDDLRSRLSLIEEDNPSVDQKLGGEAEPSSGDDAAKVESESDGGVHEDEAPSASSMGPDQATSDDMSTADQLRNEITDIEQKLADGDKIILDDLMSRKRILDETEKTSNHELAELRQELAAVDSKFHRTEQDLSVAYDERNRFIKVSLVLIPATIIPLTAALGAGVYSLFDVALWTTVKVTVGVGVVGTLLWYGWSVMRLISGVLAKIHGLEAEKRKLESKKTNLMIRQQANRNTLLRSRFDYFTYRKVLEWYEWATDSLDKMFAGLRKFGEQVQEFSEAAKSRWDTLKFENTSFKRYIVDRSYVEHLIEKFTGVEIETRQFFEHHPLSGFLDKHLSTSQIDDLKQAITKFFDDNYHFVRDMTVDDVLRDQSSLDGSGVVETVRRFFDAIKAQVGISVEPGIDQSDSIVYLGVPDPSASIVRDLLEADGLADKVRFEAFRDHTTIVGFGFKIGFPAYYWSQIEYSRSLFRQFDKRDRLFSNIDWRVPDLVPMSTDGEGEVDEVRLAALIGEAIGLVELKDNEFVFQGRAIGKNRQDVEEYLNSMKGIHDLRSIKEHIDRTQSESAEYVSMLRAFVDRCRGELDELDIRGLNDVIATADPLA